LFGLQLHASIHHKQKLCQRGVFCNYKVLHEIYFVPRAVHESEFEDFIPDYVLIVNILTSIEGEKTKSPE